MDLNFYTKYMFEMNKFLQNEVYNPNNPFYHGYFKEGDFIMRTQNKYEEDVIRVNGDTGIINFVNKTITDKNGMLKKREVAQILYDSNEYNDDNFEDISKGWHSHYWECKCYWSRRGICRWFVR